MEENRENKMQGKNIDEEPVMNAANELLKEGKKMANDIYEESKNKVHEAQENIKKYSDDLSQKVHEKPLTSLLIAGGIGFLLAAILRR